MTPETRAAIKAAAEAVPSGRFDEEDWWSEEFLSDSLTPDDGAFIVLASPANVLALLAYTERLEAALVNLRDYGEQADIAAHDHGILEPDKAGFVFGTARAALAGEPEAVG